MAVSVVWEVVNAMLLWVNLITALTMTVITTIPGEIDSECNGGHSGHFFYLILYSYVRSFVPMAQSSGKCFDMPKMWH